MDTKTALVITLIAVVVVMAASTMMPKLVYAPGGSCTSCGNGGEPPGHFLHGGPGGASAFAPPHRET